MNIQQFVTTEFGTKLWMALGRWLPTSAGHAFARTVTGVLARRHDTSLYRIMRANQAGILGPDATPEQLDAAVRVVLGHAGMTAFDLMHIMAQGEDAVLRAVDFGADFWANVELLKATGRGVLVCGCHLSNFNLAFLGFAVKGFPTQVLSAAMPATGFGLMAEMRNRGVLEETPISAGALRKAIARMRAGGACAIGVDWPVGAESGEAVPFFGRPAHLATGWARMASSANAVDLSDGVPVVTRTRLPCHQPAADHPGSDRRPRDGRAGQRPPYPGRHGKLDRRNAGAVVDVSPGVAGTRVNGWSSDLIFPRLLPQAGIDTVGLFVYTICVILDYLLNVTLNCQLGLEQKPSIPLMGCLVVRRVVER